jgi:NAD+ synthetase
MPSPYTAKESEKYSYELAKNLGIELINIPITDLMKTYKKLLTHCLKNRPADTTEENLQTRIRANILMAYSNRFGAMLLATGNKSELATGYCTLYGDMCGALAVLADALKHQVYELANYFNKETNIISKYIIMRPPSAELKPNQKDSDALPPYEILDEIVKLYVEKSKTVDEIIKKGFAKKTVLQVLEKIDKAEFKRRQAPPVLKISPKAFGQGRKVPLACKYN